MDRSEYWALRIQHDERRQWEEYLSCNVKAALYELHRDRDKRPIPYTATDFMTHAPKQDPRKRIGKRLRPATAIYREKSAGKGTKTNG